MEDKKYQVCIYVGEDLDDITGDDEKFPPAPDQCTPEMTERLVQNLIDEGHLQLVTLN